MSKLFLRLSAVLSLVALAPAASAQVLYVDSNLASGANDGSSWADAFQGTNGLKLALGAAVAGDEIYVADGLYLPTTGTGRAASFTLLNDVTIYGGFLGGESSPAERPPFGTAPSILSADLNGDDGSGMYGENVYHVLRGANTNSTAVIDGFTVVGGNSNGTNNANRGGGILAITCDPVVRNCHFIDNRSTFGGGAGYINGGSPTFIGCTFEANLGGSFGGAFDIATASNVIFDRCIFKDNSAVRAGALEVFASNGVRVTNSLFVGNTSTGGGGGGGIWIGSGSNTVVDGCTIVENSSLSNVSGGIRVDTANPTITNTILWDNEGPGGAQGPANQVTLSANVTYSTIEGGLAGVGNIDADPQFMDAAAGDYRLSLASPGIDGGSNAAVPAGITLDLASNPRFADEATIADLGAGTAPIVDMGAYEFAGADCLGTPYCPAVVNSSGQAAEICATGSSVLADNDLTLTATALPTGQFGYFLVSQSQTLIMMPGGSQGNLCVGSPFGRFNALIASSGPFARLSIDVDLTNVPLLGTVTAGTWNFQCWFRDVGSTSNFSDGVEILFQ